MISKRDSKPIKVKFAVGVNKSGSQETVYQNSWQTIYALISEPSGQYNRQEYGGEEQFDKTIIVNAGSISKQISYDTLICVEHYPVSNYQYGDYIVKKIYPIYNGEIRIGLDRREGIDNDKLYFYNNGSLLYYQTTFDSTNNYAYVLVNELFPFDINDYVWTKKPASESDTNNRLKYKSKKAVGLDTSDKRFYRLTFVSG